ncbi:MAG: hypothetical protein KKC46_17985 [Proteobacteria bacterium]|nr:hypothetical protein [Pseudomonadota bacterium]
MELICERGTSSLREHPSLPLVLGNALDSSSFTGFYHASMAVASRLMWSAGF